MFPQSYNGAICCERIVRGRGHPTITFRPIGAVFRGRGRMMRRSASDHKSQTVCPLLIVEMTTFSTTQSIVVVLWSASLCVAPAAARCVGRHYTIDLRSCRRCFPTTSVPSMRHASCLPVSLRYRTLPVLITFSLFITILFAANGCSDSQYTRVGIHQALK